MRIPIREQLAALVLLSTLVALAVIAIATWVTNQRQVLDLRSSRLQIIASLKAAQLSSNLDLMERSVRSLATRVKVQQAVTRYNTGHSNSVDRPGIVKDLESGLSGAQEQLLTLQTIIFPRDRTGGGDLNGLVNVTANGVHINLPYRSSNGSTIKLGDPGLGYPPSLYPNLTYHSSRGQTSVAHLGSTVLDTHSTILLGPWQINETFALCSITVPIINDLHPNRVLAWMTVVLDSRLILDVVDSPVGLGETGVVLLVGPDSGDNRFGPDNHFNSPATPDDQSFRNSRKLRFVVPPKKNHNSPDRHSTRDFGAHPTRPFHLGAYPALETGLVDSQYQINNAGANINCYNEQGYHVAIGYAIPTNDLCSWVLVFEQAISEAYAVVDSLRNTLLACIFGTAGGMLLFIFPLAHYGSRPIRRLRDATLRPIRPVQEAAPSEKSPDATHSSSNGHIVPYLTKPGPTTQVFEKRSSWFSRTKTRLLSPREHQYQNNQVDIETSSSRRAFRMLGKVDYGKFFIEDELTDLVQRFNEMSDELTDQYNKLEERVRERTAELEVSKRAAEAADQAKTQLVANVSHELRSPLNAILGMCTVCMQEEDSGTIKRSLQIIYKSGDLLHTLLTDLLTFSKNQAGKGLSLDEKEFRIRDIGVQVQAIFQTQANENGTTLDISYMGQWDSSGNVCGVDQGEYGPLNSGKVRDLCLWGDNQRVLQVVINLVSNGLKFTPKGGSVALKIRCSHQATAPLLDRKVSGLSFKSDKHRGSNSNLDVSQAWRIAGATTGQETHLRQRGSFASADSEDIVEPPPNASTYVFEFEVSDTGPGIPQHLQSRIFEPFVQGDLRLTKKYGGTGLGLSICSQLAKLLHGSIELESVVGVGSKFVLRIPLKLCATRLDSCATSIKRMSITSLESSLKVSKSEDDGQNTTGSTFEADAKPRLVGLSQPYFSTSSPPLGSPSMEQRKKETKLKVLVAEDNQVNQEVVLRMLKLEDIFDVEIAKDGQEAVDLVKLSMEQQSPYDLIFMDVQMPNLDGRESTRLIRQIGYSAPIVALTAFADEINQRECMESGMDYFLAKPIRRPALKHVIKTYCATIHEADEIERDPMKSAEVSPLTQTSSSLSPPSAADYQPLGNTR